MGPGPRVYISPSHIRGSALPDRLTARLEHHDELVALVGRAVRARGGEIVIPDWSLNDHRHIPLDEATDTLQAAIRAAIAGADGVILFPEAPSGLSRFDVQVAKEVGKHVLLVAREDLQPRLTRVTLALGGLVVDGGLATHASYSWDDDIDGIRPEVDAFLDSLPRESQPDLDDAAR